jgi:hypothetical protein
VKLTDAQLQNSVNAIRIMRVRKNPWVRLRNFLHVNYGVDVSVRKAEIIWFGFCYSTLPSRKVSCSCGWLGRRAAADIGAKRCPKCGSFAVLLRGVM